MQKNRFLIPLNIQLFAEKPDEEVENNKEDIEGQDGHEDNNNDQDKPKTFTQEDVDKIVQGRIAKERKSWQKELEDQKTEAEKLAGMTESQKKKYQEEKKLKNLDDREAAVTRRELTAQAKDTLADKGLPIEFADILNYKDAESCNSSIEVVEKVFQNAVEKAVEERIKGGKPPKKVPGDKGITVESIKEMSPAEINANWHEVQRVLKENK